MRTLLDERMRLLSCSSLAAQCVVLVLNDEPGAPPVETTEELVRKLIRPIPDFEKASNIYTMSNYADVGGLWEEKLPDERCGPCGAPVKKRGQICKRCQRARGGR